MSPPSDASPSIENGPDFDIVKGMCYTLLAYSIGLSIDLERCERLITEDKQRPFLNHRHRAPDHFNYRLAPLRITQEATPLALGPFQSHTSVDIVLYDFGALSVIYHIPIQGPFSRLALLSDALYERSVIRDDARKRVERLLTVIEPTIVRPSIADMVEGYAIFDLQALRPPGRVESLSTSYRQQIAQLLRCEHTSLSAQEVDDAFSHRISFGPNDMVVVDWNATLIFASDAADVRAVLEFANVELLEMRYLDDQLDKALDEAYDALASQPQRRLRLPGSSTADLRRIAQLQVDSAVLFEGVNNALKLLGDQYLARVYRLASQRFHLEEWDRSIIRKLDTLESIYKKISDQTANRRLEVLEWIIILLIGVSILVSFIPGLSH